MTRLVGANAAAVSTSRGRTRRVIRETVEVPSLSAAAFVEVADVRVRGELDHGEWPVVLQAPAGDPDRAGVALAFRRWVDVLGSGWVQGCRRGFGIRRRWWLWADVDVPGLGRRRLIVGHLPPMRVWKRSRRWEQMMRAHRELCARSPYPTLSYADFNKLARAVRPALGLPVRMRHIVGWAFSPGHEVRSWPARVGSDHLAVVLQVRPGSTS